MDIKNTLGLIIDKLNRYDKVGASILLSSLSTEIYSMNDDQKFEYFFHSARCYEMVGNFECMCQAANSTYNFSKNKEQKVIALDIWGIANMNLYKTKNDSRFLNAAENLLNQAIVLGKDCNSKEVIIEPLWHKSQLHRKKGEYNQAIKILNEAAEVADDQKLYDYLAITICQIAEVYSLMGFKNIALSEYQRAESIAKQSCNYNFYCRIVLHRLAMMFELSESDQSFADRAKEDIINIAHQRI